MRVAALSFPKISILARPYYNAAQMEPAASSINVAVVSRFKMKT